MKGGCLTTTPANGAIDFSDFASLTTVITDNINITGILTILAGAGAIALGFVGFWWGVRKAQKIIFAAFRKGRFSQ